MVFFKEVVAHYLFPLSVSLELLVAGLISVWIRRTQTIGKLLLSAGTLMLLFFSHPLLWQTVLPSLDVTYDPLVLTDAAGAPAAGKLASTKWIVVLSGGATADSGRPLADQLGSETVVRLVEGLALHRSLPAAKLILSGGPVSSPTPEAEVMGKAAQILGADPAQLILERQSLDTESQARLVHPIVGNDDFILVTSASHISRYMALFKKEGMNPIAAPIGSPVRGRVSLALTNLYPQPGSLLKAQTAVWEYFGLAWSKVRGRV
jgi:uncharacterized SAM-binding protein YcdF (DUF218 family)